MKYLLVWLAVMPLPATNKINFLNIHVDHQGNRLEVSTSPEPLLEYEFLRDERYNIDKFLYDHVLDAPFRQTAFLMRTLERNRGSIYDRDGAPLPILSFEFELSVRRETGKIIHQKEYKVVIGLDGEADKGVIICDQAGMKHQFTISKLTEQEEYGKYVSHLAFPFEKQSLPAPAESNFLVDLYYNWPEVEVKENEFNVFDLFPSAILWDRGPITKLKMHLGTTYVYKDGEGWGQVRSDFLRSHQRAVDEFTRVLEAREAGDSRELIANLEDYVDHVPSDRTALRQLMEAYLAAGMDAEAYDLITRFQPFFATIRQGIANKNELAENAERKRNQLLGRKAYFKQAEGVALKITGPKQNDLVTSTTDLTFTMAGNEADILSIECYIGDELITSLVEPPFKVPFSVDGAYGRKRLRVVAYFEDETFAEDSVSIEAFKVDEEQAVRLVGLQVSVFQSQTKAARSLDKQDFVIQENRKKVDIEHFRKSTAPLRVAILVDTSISMFGDKLYQSQYALKTFLSKLAPEDRAAVFSFDNKVLKLMDFTNDYDQVVRSLMTLSPHGNTSLYDAMLIAHDALMGQNGTKAMIVISDGADSDSATTDYHVSRLLRDSPVMVYSVVLPDRDTMQGSRFLQEISRLSGSTYTKVRSVDKLSEVFDRIYEDLKNIYFMDYYTDLGRFAERKIKVKLEDGKANIKWTRLN